MRYPLDVEAELDCACDKLTHVRVSGEKWAYFRSLVEEINAAHHAGLAGEKWAPLDLELNLRTDTERFGFGAAERKLIVGWMQEVDKAYQAGYKMTYEPIVMEGPRIIDPETGRTIKRIRNAVDLESVIYSFIRQQKAVCLQMPGKLGSALIQPAGV